MRIILLGLPGSGKEELAAKLAGHYQVPVLTLENTLKEIAAEKNELGRLIKEAAFAGKFSDELIMAALRIRLARDDAANGFVLEDFPRSTGQAETLDILMKGLRKPINAVLKINIDPDELMEHLVGQITCQNCGEKYNIYSNPPVVEGMCSVCGEKIRRRPDDYEENIANRLRNCEMIMAPLEQYYQPRQMLHLVPGELSAAKRLKAAVKLLDKLPVSEMPDDDSPPLPTDESLLKALAAPRGDSDQPRRRGRPRRRKDEPDSQAIIEASGATLVVDEKLREAASKVLAAGRHNKEAGSRKSRAKKAVTKKAAAKKATAKKAVAKKATVKKSTARKAATKKVAAKKTTVKKATVKKAVAKKAVAKKTATKKAVVAKKASTKKAAAKKATVKKAVAKKTTAKKAVAKKAAKKKVAAKKATVKKSTLKKAVTKKAAAQKTTAKKKPGKNKLDRKKSAQKKQGRIKGRKK